MTEVWTKWEGQVINGVYPLRRYLSASDHSAVFLTESKAHNLPDAALKLVPAIPTLTQAQLSNWTMAATLSHPHLIRLLDAGRCQLGGLQFFFVVMEYAEQTLSQILPQRALTPGEVREMLLPTLSALAFLHRGNLVQGRLKPSNILVVNDQLKLASDTVHRGDGSFSAAGDIWALGITIVEALTQHPPSWPDGKSETASLPAALPPTFVEIVRQCLDRDPANRPTAADLEAQINPAPQSTAVSAPQAPTSMPKARASTPKPLVLEVPDRAPNEPPKQRLFARAVAVLFMVVVAVWAGFRVLSSQTSLERVAPPAAASQNSQTSLSMPPEVSVPSTGAKSADLNSAPSRLASRPSDHPVQQLARGSPLVLHEEIPDVSRGARNTIRGHIKVAVRVTVDSSGNVVDETLEKRGPSKYFARLATEAARKWKFAPADNQDSRKWLLRFEFTRAGTTGHAAGATS